MALERNGELGSRRRPLTYAWTQVAGQSVGFDPTSPTPSFQTPSVLVGGETLTFQLVVDDGLLASPPTAVNVTVKNVNHLPVADAGDDQTVAENCLVALDGSASYDEDGDSLAYSWVQLAGPLVMLDLTDPVRPTFVSPFVGPAGETFSFELTVDDGLATSTSSVDVFVENFNHDPVADAGPDQTRDELTTVTLDGTGSSDPDNDALTYQWVQVAGPSVALADATTPIPSFTAPEIVGGASDALAFSLTSMTATAASPATTSSSPCSTPMRRPTAVSRRRAPASSGHRTTSCARSRSSVSVTRTTTRWSSPSSA